MEWARSSGSRGFVASLPQLGVPCGLVLANVTVLAFSRLSGDQFLVWGWRVPFSLSLVLVAIGLYIRLGIEETPVFRRVVAERQVVRRPVLDVIRQQPRAIGLSALVRMGEQAPQYIFTAFIFAYGTGTLGVSRDFLLASVVVAQVLSFGTIPLAGHISDLVGRRKVYAAGAALMGVFGFVYFWLLNTRSPALIFVAILLAVIPHGLMYGPQAALIAELFPGRVRYSGASLGYQLASLIAAWLLARTHSSTPIAIYILACAVISLGATALLQDRAVAAA
jgi:MFS family permease